MPPPTLGCRPKLRHKPVEPVPRRFDVQIKNVEHTAFLIVEGFPAGAEGVVHVHLPRVMPLVASPLCQTWVHVQEFGTEVVLWGWSGFCRKHQVRTGAIVVLKLDNFGFKVKVFNRGNSTVNCYCSVYALIGCQRLVFIPSVVVVDVV